MKKFQPHTLRSCEMPLTLACMWHTVNRRGQKRGRPKLRKSMVQRHFRPAQGINPKCGPLIACTLPCTLPAKQLQANRTAGQSAVLLRAANLLLIQHAGSIRISTTCNHQNRINWAVVQRGSANLQSAVQLAQSIA